MTDSSSIIASFASLLEGSRGAAEVRPPTTGRALLRGVVGEVL